MNFKKLMLSVGLSAMALLAMPGSTLTSPVSVQAATHEHILGNLHYQTANLYSHRDRDP